MEEIKKLCSDDSELNGETWNKGEQLKDSKYKWENIRSQVFPICSCFM